MVKRPSAIASVTTVSDSASGCNHFCAFRGQNAWVHRLCTRNPQSGAPIGAEKGIRSSRNGLALGTVSERVEVTVAIK